MTDPTLDLTEDSFSRLRQLHDQAVTWVNEQFYRTHPQMYAKFGEGGRKRCEEDVDYHLQFLTAALESRSPCLFTDYVCWLASVLESRGITTAHIRDCLQLLEQFLGAHLAGTALVNVQRVLEQGVIGLEGKQPTLPAFYRHLPTPAPESHTLVPVLLEGNRHIAQTIMTKSLQAGLSLVDIGVAIIQPALYEVGWLWQIHRITVAQEHLATALCQHLLTQAFSQMDMAELQDRKASFACVEGNHHSLGLRMVADVFELEGWEVAYLGANTPTSALLEQIDGWRPDLLSLSLSLPQHIPVARTVIDHCRAEFKARRPTIMVGGLVLNSVDTLWRQIGADLWCPDARVAQREALA